MSDAEKIYDMLVNTRNRVADRYNENLVRMLANPSVTDDVISRYRQEYAQVDGELSARIRAHPCYEPV